MKKTLFIVDDDQFYSHILRAKIEAICDYHIEAYSAGQDCVNNLHKQPDIILLDHHLGDTNGFEVLKDIKTIHPNIHVVMLSGQQEMKIAIRALRCGATDYLIKNVDDNEDKLNDIIKDCEQISRARAEVRAKSKRKGLFNILLNF